jgi:hypothetical protein
MDRTLLPTRELCFLPMRSVFSLYSAELTVGFTLAAAVRYVRVYLPALGFELPPLQMCNDRAVICGI